jgi:hypothetical protein
MIVRTDANGMASIQFASYELSGASSRVSALAGKQVSSVTTLFRLVTNYRSLGQAEWIPSTGRTRRASGIGKGIFALDEYAPFIGGQVTENKELRTGYESKKGQIATLVSRWLENSRPPKFLSTLLHPNPPITSSLSSFCGGR